MGDIASDNASNPSNKSEETSSADLDSNSPMLFVMGKSSDVSPRKAYPSIKAHMPKHLGAPGASKPTDSKRGASVQLKPHVYGKSRLERRLHGKPPPSKFYIY